MKFVFVSNYFNHHQKPFCEEMYQKLGNDFVFIATSVMREERKLLGYTQSEYPKYVLLSYEGKKQLEQAYELILNADVVIAGSAPNNLLKPRIKQRKLLLRYSERPFKKKNSILKKYFHAMNFRLRDLWNNNIYMLCASAYTAFDYSSVGMYKNRAYKWGYFPVVKQYDVESLLSHKSSNSIMWCGRFLDWKHPEEAIFLAKKLKDYSYDFEMNLIGTGEKENEIKQLVKKLELTNYVNFLGAKSPEEVRTCMENAGIYIFTSDHREGWGAVLNEAMSSACAVVASHAIGSVPYLIQNGKNGIVYMSKNVDMLFTKVKYLLDYPEEQVRIGRQAYITMNELWNANLATERLLQLTEKLVNGDTSPDVFEKGPCSKANIISDTYFSIFNNEIIEI